MKNDNRQNFEKLVSNEKSGWLEKAAWKEENRNWLEKSNKIAIKVLRAIREQKETRGMTQKMLAEAMGVSPQYINKIVKGQENLTLETIAKIEQVLGIVLIEIPASTSVNVPLGISDHVESINRNKTVPMGGKIIVLNNNFTQPTGTNG